VTLGCKEGIRGTKDHLLVDKLVMFLTRNIQMTWINNQHFLKISMSSWRTTLTLNGHALGHVNIKRGISGVIYCPLLSL